LQFVAIAAGGPAERTELLTPITYLPHSLSPVITGIEDAAETLRFLVEEAQYRNSQAICRPLVVVLIDHVVALLEAGGKRIAGPLATLLQCGDEAGIRLILTTERPAAAALDTVARSTLPVRIVGKVASEADAYAAAGVTGSQAEYSQGNGDFVAVVHDSVVHFQAAYVGDYDFHLSLDRLQRQRAPALLAQPTVVRPTHRADEPQVEREFVLDLDGRPAILGNEADPDADEF
jgi:DNA segregation ATPase FtsK/SpoIIIE-like protein